jgi:SAM-dependent methyltransferase
MLNKLTRSNPQQMLKSANTTGTRSPLTSKDKSTDLEYRSNLPDLWSITVRSIDECRTSLEANIPRFQARRAIESELQEQLTNRTSASLPGYCWTCGCMREFSFDMKYSNGVAPNWRERMVCPHCLLNNRLRLSVQWFERISEGQNPAIYMTEQLTPLARYMVDHFKDVIGSEYLGTEHSPGQLNKRGIRHEDVTALSFDDAMFDFVLSFDVLEHVPDYRKALAEFYRVLRPGGRTLISVPFGLLTDRNIVRARIAEDGQIEHLLPPDYHGDPVDPQKGILCYYHFGWEMLEELRKVGFSDAYLSIVWSLPFGHIGQEQVLIGAQK